MSKKGKAIEKAVNTAKDMVSGDKSRDDLFVAIDNAIHHVWDLPAGLPDRANMRTFTSSDASDAVKTAVQTLADLVPHFMIPPLTDQQEDKERHNGYEKAIKYLFWQADMRASGNISHTLVSNVVKYGMAAGKVTFLPHEISAHKAMGNDTRRLKQAMRYGPFAIELYNPREIHTRYSGWSMETVLTHKVMRVQDILYFWGELAGEVKALKDTTGYEDHNYATLYDLHVDGKRFLWTELATSATMSPPN